MDGNGKEYWRIQDRVNALNEYFNNHNEEQLNAVGVAEVQKYFLKLKESKYFQRFGEEVKGLKFNINRYLDWQKNRNEREKQSCLAEMRERERKDESFFGKTKRFFNRGKNRIKSYLGMADLETSFNVLEDLFDREDIPYEPKTFALYEVLKKIEGSKLSDDQLELLYANRSFFNRAAGIDVYFENIRKKSLRILDDFVDGNLSKVGSGTNSIFRSYFDKKYRERNGFAYA